MLTYAFGIASDGIYLHTRHDGKLFNLKQLRAKTKVTCVLIREMLFADDAALVSQTQKGLQCLMDRLSKACKEFALTISIKKTEVMAQDAEIVPPLQSILMVPTSLWFTTSNTWDQPSCTSLVARCRDECPHWECSHSNG